jgi:hypothetical protein
MSQKTSDEMDFKELMCQGADLIELPQERSHDRILQNMVLDRRVPSKAG